MAIISVLLLLAACSDLVISGPLPHLKRRQSEPSSVTTLDSVRADTALVVEPIKGTVFTEIIPGVTFHNTKGEPVITDDDRTILSTSLITPTTPPTTEASAIVSTSETPSPKSTSVDNASPTASSGSPSAVISTSVAARENGTSQETSSSGPMFTYSPAESATASPSATPIDTAPSSPPPAVSPTGTGGVMPGFDFPAPSLGNSTGPKSTPLVTSESPAQETPLPSSANLSDIPTSEETQSTRFVTETEYTTVFVKPTGSNASNSPVETASPSEAPNPDLPQEVSPNPVPAPSSVASEQVQASPSSAVAVSPSSAAAILPSESLQPPPVVIITQFTTVTPNPEPTQEPERSSLPPAVPSEPEPSSAPIGTTSPAPEYPEPTPPLYSPSSPAAPSEPLQPTSTIAEQPPSPSSESPSSPTGQPSAPTDAPPAPSSPPPPESDGPLIITPIPESQIFTVTITATEKETATVTATVTVPA